jgi:hypothetical protein
VIHNEITNGGQAPIARQALQWIGALHKIEERIEAVATHSAIAHFLGNPPIVHADRAG